MPNSRCGAGIQRTGDTAIKLIRDTTSFKGAAATIVTQAGFQLDETGGLQRIARIAGRSAV